MQRHHFGILVAISLALAACGQQLAQRTDGTAAKAASGKTIEVQSLTAAGGTTLRTYVANVNATVTTRIPGFPDQVAKTPPGLKAAFLFVNGQVKTRMDVPAAQVRDGRPRIITYDTATQTAKIVFADTLAADTSIDTAAMVNMVRAAGVSGTSQLDPTQPFIKKTTSQFQTRAQSSGSTTASVARTDGTSGGNYTTATASLRTGSGNTQQSTSTFDPNIGAVTRVSSTAETSDVRQTSNTSLTYTDVTNLPNVIVPVRITTTQTVLSKYNGQSASVTQDLTYDNSAINTLSDSYFTVGGQ